MVEHDPDATRLAYSQVKASGPEDCGCGGCKNWLMARPTVYPREFLDMLDRLGIDSTKESEVYDVAEVPEKPKSHYYGGWFHFFGTISFDKDVMPEVVQISDIFSYSIHLGDAPAPDVFASSKGTSRIEFNTIAPWLISDEEYARSAPKGSGGL